MHANVPLLLDRDQIGFILNACIIHNLCICVCYVLLMLFNACGYPNLPKIVSIFLYMLRNFSQNSDYFHCMSGLFLFQGIPQNIPIPRFNYNSRCLFFHFHSMQEIQRKKKQERTKNKYIL